MIDLSDDQQKAVEQIKKLLNLASKNTSEAEASAAAAKAQELLARYNLDTATVERAAGKDGKREEAKVNGGFYSFHRDLWGAVARLNFCLYWTQNYYEVVGKMYHDVRIMKKRHCVVGRIVNTRATIAMAGYLDKAIERLTAERLRIRGENEDARTGLHLYSNWAVSYRKGATARVVSRLQDQREKHLAAERQRQRVAERASTGATTETALSLTVYIDNETDANLDYLYGAGWSAGQAAKRAEQAAKRKRDLEEYTAWAAANPEEARKKEAAREKGQRRSRSRGGSSPRNNVDYGAYYAGYDAAEKISLEQQVDNDDQPRRRLA